MPRLIALAAALFLASAAVAQELRVLTGSETYRAAGNEPFWSVMLEAGEMRLSRLGAEDLRLPVIESHPTDTGVIHVIAADPARALRAVLERLPRICRDSMTGMPHPETVTVSMGDETLSGCGGDPLSLLTGQTWVVEDIGGAGVIESARATLGFDATGRVFGNGSCNRFMGDAALSGEGLRLGPLASTRMACPEAVMAQERRVFEALEQVIGFDIDATGALVLLGPEGAVLTARAATDGSAP